MKIIGHTPDGDCIVIISQADYDGLDNQIIGVQFKMLRKRAGYTLKDVSEKTGISISFLSDIERQKTEPSNATYRKLKSFYERP